MSEQDHRRVAAALVSSRQRGNAGAPAAVEVQIYIHDGGEELMRVVSASAGAALSYGPSRSALNTPEEGKSTAEPGWETPPPPPHQHFHPQMFRGAGGTALFLDIKNSSALVDLLGRLKALLRGCR